MLVGVATEVMGLLGFGRCRMVMLEDASAAIQHPCVSHCIAPGPAVTTDGQSGYRRTSRSRRLLFCSRLQPALLGHPSCLECSRADRLVAMHVPTTPAKWRAHSWIQCSMTPGNQSSAKPWAGCPIRGSVRAAQHCSRQPPTPDRHEEPNRVCLPTSTWTIPYLDKASTVESYLSRPNRLGGRTQPPALIPAHGVILPTVCGHGSADSDDFAPS